MLILASLREASSCLLSLFIIGLDVAVGFKAVCNFWANQTMVLASSLMGCPITGTIGEATCVVGLKH